MRYCAINNAVVNTSCFGLSSHIFRTTARCQIVDSTGPQIILPWIRSELTFSQSPLHALKEHCDCHGIDSTTKDDTWYICNNASLGPQFLPWRLPLLSLVSDYDRFGGLTPAEFLAKWRIWNGKKNKWDWNYPKDDGFHLDVCDRPMKSFMTLKAGFKVDRFGGEGGTFLGAADAPFSQRSLPPDALNVCKDDTVPCATTKDHPWQYYVYNVARDFEVIGGPIAPGFGQPGLGIQFYTGRIGNVSQLVDLGLLKRLNLNDISLGPGPSGKCGRKPVNCTCKRPD